MAEKNEDLNQDEVPVQERLRDYELVAVLSSVAPEEKRTALLNKIRGVITDNGGEIIEAETQKAYSLAYPIKKERQAFLVSFSCRAPVTLPYRINEELKREQTLLRYLLTEKPKTKTKTKADSLIA